MTPHIESKLEDIAPLVLMPGDPLRAKYIAEHYLTDVKLVNKLRNMYAYTGYYNNVKITVMASGMGIPSIGIYAYELFEYYKVEKIIRIGTSGSFCDDVNINDLILATSSNSISSFDNLMINEDIKLAYSSASLNDTIISTAVEQNIELKSGKIITSDVFDHYVDFDNFLALHDYKDCLAVEMEAFGLFVLANKFNREAACLLTVVDTHKDSEEILPEDREKSLDKMIVLALESIIKK